MSMEAGTVGKGWTVYGADGKKIGEVEEVHPTYFTIRKGLIFKKDIYVPAASIGQLRGNEIHLTVRQGEIDALGWDTAPFATGGKSESWATVRRIQPAAEVAPLINRVFSREVLRIPIRAEQVSVEKTPVITGEVALTKEQEVELTPVQATVRATEVDVVESIQTEHEVVRRPGEADIITGTGGASTGATRTTDTTGTSRRRGQP